MPASSIPAAALVQPEVLARELQNGHFGEAAAKPMMLQVGSHVLFAEAHLPGSTYMGAAGQEAGLEELRQQLATVAKATPVLLYCGCCPWDRCPNIGRAYALLQSMGMEQVKVLYLAQNFGSDWVAKGYPVNKGR